MPHLFFRCKPNKWILFVRAESYTQAELLNTLRLKGLGKNDHFYHLPLSKLVQKSKPGVFYISLYLLSSPFLQQYNGSQNAFKHSTNETEKNETEVIFKCQTNIYCIHRLLLFMLRVNFYS